MWNTSTGPQTIGLCLRSEKGRARFVIDQGAVGDELLDLLTRRRQPVALVRPFGAGWVVSGSDARDDFTRSTVDAREFNPRHVYHAAPGRIVGSR